MNKLKFIGRKQELRKFEQLFLLAQASCVTITGRRRIGKSRLVEEAAKGKDLISITGLAPTESLDAQAQRDEFAKQLARNFRLPSFSMFDWGDLFFCLSEHLNPKREQIVLLDEISWMGSADPTFLGKLKIAWDLYFSKHPNLVLVFCGSVSSWIEKNILSSTAFYGRINAMFRLQPLSLDESLVLLKNVGFKTSLTEQLMLIFITGGVPWYIERISPAISAEKNIQSLCFNSDGLLFNDFERIFNDLFQQRSNIYKLIVQRLSDGAAEFTTIAEDIDYSASAALTGYLNDLSISGFVRSNHTWSFNTAKKGRSFQFRLIDCYTRFYLKCIEPNKDQIMNDRFTQESIWEFKNIDSIMGLQLETLLLANRNLLWAGIGIAPGEIVMEDPFFQRQTKAKKGCQIDYLIQTKNNVLYLCEIKFSRKRVGTEVVDEVREKVKALKVPKHIAVVTVLITVNGVTDAVENEDFFHRILDVERLLEYK